MDPITVLGVCSAVGTFVDLTVKLVSRIHELNATGSIPRAFLSLETRLELILNIVKQTEGVRKTLSENTVTAFDKLVAECYEEVQELRAIISKFTVEQKDSRWIKSRKAICSLAEEAKVDRIAAVLLQNIQLLMHLQMLASKTTPEAMVTGAPSMPPSYARASGIFIFPFIRDNNFVGRADVLKDLEAKVASERRVSIAGPGGIGKSQVTIEFAYRFKAMHSGIDIFWVYGATVERFEQAYQMIAKKLQIPSWDNPDIYTPDIVVEYLNETNQPYLLILDNADSMDIYGPKKPSDGHPAGSAREKNLARYIPNNLSCGHVLITSRDARVASRLSSRGTHITLQPMNLTEAKELLSSQLQDEDLDIDDESVEKIVENLDCLPLAVQQAASYIKENWISTAEYLELLEAEDADEEGGLLDADLHDPRRDESSANSVYKAWKLSFDRLKKQNPRAIELLSLLSMLDRQSIPRRMLSSQGLVTSIGILKSFHMLTVRGGSGSLQLHRLTQRFVQLHLRRSGTLHQYQAAAIACVSKYYPTEIGFQEWEICESLAPHVATVIEYIPQTEDANLDLANLLCWAADFDVEKGLLPRALERAKKSLDIFRKLTLPGDERLTSAIWLYGRLLYYEATCDQDFRTAAKLLEEAYRLSEPRTMNRAESAFELAHLYYDSGKENECLEMGKASYECWEAMEGASSIRSLDNMHDYSIELALLGYRQAAVANWKKIIEHCPKSGALAQTEEIFRKRSMACIAEFEGDAALAETLYSNLIQLSIAAYGSEHVHVFDYRLSRMEQVMLQCRYDEAMRDSEAIIIDCKGKSEWRIEAFCHELLAECYRRQGLYADEESPRASAADFPRRFLGEENIETIEAVDGYARCLVNNDKFTSAAAMFDNVLQWRVREQGPDHRDTRVTKEMLAICKLHLGRDADAAELLLHLLSAEVSSTPTSTSFDRRRLKYNLCCTLWNRQMWPELELRCREALCSSGQTVIADSSSDDSGSGSGSDENSNAEHFRRDSGYSSRLSTGSRKKGGQKMIAATLSPEHGHYELRYRIEAMLIGALEKLGHTEEALALRAESFRLEDVEIDGATELRQPPVQPPAKLQEKPRFGRMFHPRTWSS